MQKVDWPMHILMFIPPIVLALYIELYLGIDNFMLFAFFCGLLGMLLEFVSGWIWWSIFGTRIYIYYKKTFMGLTTFFNWSYWTGVTIYFYLCLRFINILPTEFLFWSTIITNLGLSSLLVVIYLVLWAISDGLDGVFNKKSGFTFSKYGLFLVFLWGIIFALVLLTNSYLLLIYFVFTTVTGFILEGLLGQLLRLIFGEYIWIYTRKPVFGKATSWLLLPVWAIASLMVYILVAFMSVM